MDRIPCFNAEGNSMNRQKPCPELLRIVRALRQPTNAKPGSEDKIRVLEQRAQNRIPLFHKKDRQL
jgi:hypothetical protein